MEELMEMLECIEDKRQQSKVRYPIKEIVLIVFSCTISNVDDWEDMEIWANHYIDLLCEYLPYENGIPSHDTIQRVMGMIDSAYIQQAYNKCTSLLEKAEKEKLKKIIAIDGKTMRGNTKNGEKPNHIVSAWNREDGYSMGQQSNVIATFFVSICSLCTLRIYQDINTAFIVVPTTMLREIFPVFTFMQPIFIDTKGGVYTLEKALFRYPTLICVRADQGYRCTFKNTFEIFHNIKIDISPRIKNEFKVQPLRWVVKRTLSWFGSSRHLSKDYEIKPFFTNAFVLSPIWLLFYVVFSL